jgi:crossover junction endodeoxyribonuclease RuvC
MRVLGIDPGSRITGLGVVESTADGVQSVDYQCIKMGNLPLPRRLGLIYQGVTEIIEQHQPDMVAIEQVFVANNARSALVLGHARGSAICAAVNLGADVSEYSALQIKRAVVGSGNASKEQVQHMVRVLLGLTRTPGVDEADALACAICHIHTDQVARKLESAQAESQA